MEVPMYDEIARQIRLAEANGRKVAMFHYQVLKNARMLDKEDPIEFCHAVGMNESYAIEFRKMINLARLMEEKGEHIR